MPMAFYWTAGLIAVVAGGFFVGRFFWRMNALIEEMSQTITQMRIAMDARRTAQGQPPEKEGGDEKPVDYEHRKYF